MTTLNTLALFGGPRAVPAPFTEPWPTALCRDILDQYAAAFQKVIARHKDLTEALKVSGRDVS